MEYSKIVAISGLPGLHEVTGERSDGLIVRPLNEQSPKFISAMRHNFTSMDAVGIYVEGNDTRDLPIIFWDMKQSSETAPDANASDDDIRAYFNSIVADIDNEKVYTSDMKKILKWFKALTEHDLIVEPKEEEEAPAEAPEETDAE